MRILTVEDNKKLAQSITRGLMQEGYAADFLLSGSEAEQRVLLCRDDYDFIILDVLLPGKNGLDVLRTLRRAGVRTPIIMLSAQDAVEDKISGLDGGADDYLVKPFAFDELLSRIRALARRPRETLTTELCVGILRLDTVAREVSIGNSKIDLTLKEFRILEFFMMYPGVVLSRQRIIDHMWDFDFNPLSRAVDVHLNNLRNKLENNHGITIETIRGIGYRLTA